MNRSVPRVIVLDTPAERGHAARRLVVESLAERAAPVLGLATGSSPLALYAALRRDPVKVRDLMCVALDEYRGLSLRDPRSYRATLESMVTGPLGIRPEHLHLPGFGVAGEPESPWDFERRLVEAGGVDVQILGIGGNGHIAFNEPGSPADSVTREVRLAPETRRANSRFFASFDATPTRAVTQGIATIMRARRIVLMASGADKARILADALCGPVTEAIPASFLQTHPDVAVVIDPAAASLLGDVGLAR